MGSIQVCEEGVDSFAEEDAISQVDGRSFHPGPFHDVCQRQIGEHAFFFIQFDQLGENLGVETEGIEGMHDPFWGAGGARRIDDGGQVVPGADGVALNGTIGGDEHFPRGPIVRAGGGKANTVYTGGDAALGGFPVVGGAEEAGFGLAMLQNLADGFSLKRRVDRDGDVSRHPDGQVCHDPPGAVAGKDGDPAPRFPILRLQPGCDAADFGHSLAPGPVAHVAAAVGLGEENSFGPLALPFVDALKRKIVRTEIAWHRFLRQVPLAFFTAAVRAGTISKRSPTTP